MESTHTARKELSRRLTAVVAVVLIIALGAVLAYVDSLPKGGESTGSYPPYTNLPAGCVKPPGGFLVIANINGFNDSKQHGAPTDTWPIITVKQGTTVNITVCNADFQAHGFQIAHYVDNSIETVEPGQVAHLSFVADTAGNFTIYCSIPCSIHVYMTNGRLTVTAS